MSYWITKLAQSRIFVANDLSLIKNLISHQTKTLHNTVTHPKRRPTPQA